MEFWKKLCSNLLWGLPTNFVTPFRTTSICGASQSKLSIKSYDCLKFLRPKFLQLKIYDKSIQHKNSTIKYTLNQVTDKIFGKKKFITILINFTKLLTYCKENR